MNTEETAHVTFEEDAPITVGTIRDSRMLEGTVVTGFGAQVLAYANGRTGLNLLLDFEIIDYLASAALTELIKINDAVVAGGGSLRLCGLLPHVEKVFEITNFTKLFEINPGEGVAHAKARFKRSIEISQQEEAWDKRHER